jgi:hypothetical protein
VVSVDEASKGVRSLKRSGADMAPFHQLLNMKVDGGMPARVSAAPLGLVLNDPVIQRQAHCCIIRRESRGPAIRAPSYIHKRHPYVAIGRTHERYRSLLCLGQSPRTEFPRDNMARTEVRALLVIISNHSDGLLTGVVPI